MACLCLLMSNDELLLKSSLDSLLPMLGSVYNTIIIIV